MRNLACRINSLVPVPHVLYGRLRMLDIIPLAYHVFIDASSVLTPNFLSQTYLITLTQQSFYTVTKRLKSQGPTLVKEPTVWYTRHVIVPQMKLLP